MNEVRYEQIFLVNPEFINNNEKIGALSIFIKCKLYSLKTKEEVVFEMDKPILTRDNKNLYIYNFSDFIECSFDKNEENLIKIIIKEEELKRLGYKIEYTISEYSKDISGNCFIDDDSGDIYDPTEISREEFFEILKNNKENFDIRDNKPTQCVSCF